MGLLAMLAATAMAQGQGQRGGPGGRGGMGMGGPMILGAQAVQEELKLTEEQKGKVQEMVEGLREEMMGLREKMADVAQEERFAKMREFMEETNAKARKELTSLLKPEQMKRFEQVELQARGLQAFADAKVQEALKVTAEQKEKLEGLMTEVNEKRRTIMEDAQGDFQAAMGKFRELQNSTREKVMAMMTEDQKKSWKDMTGEPFEMPMGPGVGGPGPRRGPIN
jgi:Spy/CpxP family protein refolding chaperone